MHVYVKGNNIKITPSINTYVKEKLKKIKYYFNHIIHAQIILDVIKQDHLAEVTVTVEKHHFHNRVKSEDLYKSIDLIFDKLEIQVRRYKEYLTDKRKKDVKIKEEDVQVSKIDSVIVDEIKNEIKPMDDLEAVMQLKIEENIKAFLYMNVGHQLVYSFIFKKNDYEYDILFYEDQWEKKSVLLTENNQIVYDSVEAVSPSLESIEGAIEFLETYPEYQYRFYISVRTQRNFLLYRNGKNHYNVVRM